MQLCHKFITWHLCVAQHVSGISPPVIRSVQLHYELLVLLLEHGSWSVVGCGLAGYDLPDHDQQRSNRYAPTATLQRKHQVINLWNCCILLVDLFEMIWLFFINILTKWWLVSSVFDVLLNHVFPLRNQCISFSDSLGWLEGNHSHH